MTKRAKLNLTQNDNKANKQPAAFDIDQQQIEAKPDQDKAAKAASGKKRESIKSVHTTGPSESIDNDEHAQAETTTLSSNGMPTWLNKKTLLKTAVLIGAAAVAIYLIKKRFR